MHNQAWRETYAGLMPADFLAGLDDARSVARWRERLEHPAPHVAVHVALADGAVIGFATAGRTRDTDLPEPAHEPVRHQPARRPPRHRRRARAC
ncbi:hypothetical protein GCM10025868_39130 [Angustibacter aerolatus]|uniref:N-acetyltransferase domain-containing protein n=1 Tax=Angustibacter aerolatus TaxID=1162965 RepID=A0ABQ6JKC0_9ACTN|nr:hypothetical protein GCM10025868_39130 [Angustibacter aerolatus]